MSTRPKRCIQLLERYRDGADQESLDAALVSSEPKRKRGRGDGTPSLKGIQKRFHNIADEEANDHLESLCEQQVQRQILDDETQCTSIIQEETIDEPPIHPLPADQPNSLNTTSTQPPNFPSISTSLNPAITLPHCGKSRPESSLEQPRDGRKMRVLFTQSGRRYKICQNEYLLACAAPTLASVVKHLTIAVITPEKTEGAVFRRRRDDDETLSRTVIHDIIQVTRMVLRLTDKTSNKPVLKIMNKGESQRILRRNMTEGTEIVDTTVKTMNERKKIFTEALSDDQVQTWACQGLKAYRNKQNRN